MTDVLERLPGVAEAYVDFELREAYLIVDDARFPGVDAAIEALRGIGKDCKLAQPTQTRATQTRATQSRTTQTGSNPMSQPTD